MYVDKLFFVYNVLTDKPSIEYYSVQGAKSNAGYPFYDRQPAIGSES